MSIFEKIAKAVFQPRETDLIKEAILQSRTGTGRLVPKSLTAAEMRARDEGSAAPITLSEALGQHKSARGIPSKPAPFDKVPETFKNNWEKNNPLPTEAELKDFTKWLKVEIGLMAASKRDRWVVRYDIDRNQMTDGPLFFNVTIAHRGPQELNLSIRSAIVVMPCSDGDDIGPTWSIRRKTYETRSNNAERAKRFLNNAVVKACREWGWFTPNETLEEKEALYKELDISDFYSNHLDYDLDIMLCQPKPKEPEVPATPKVYWNY